MRFIGFGCGTNKTTELDFSMSASSNYIVIDQGTSSTKAFLFDSHGRVIHASKIKHSLSKPEPFHVECDSQTILNACIKLFHDMISAADGQLITGAGMAVQRSTFLFWDRKTLEPITPALSWQDSRAHGIVDEFSQHQEWIWDITGTPLSGHFGGPKFLYMIRNNKCLAKKIKSNEVIFGPLSAYLTHALTGNAAIDESIAGRSQFFNLKTRSWSPDCLDLFGVPVSVLPRLVTTSYDFGSMLNTKIPLRCVMGDQQAALIGQAGLKPGSMASNFGTSASVQYNTGTEPNIVPGLISSVLFSNEQQRFNMVEGTINSGNSIFYHLEKVLDIEHHNMHWDRRCSDHSTSGIFVPGFSGLAAPYWSGGFDDIYWELDKRDHNAVIRAAMESIGFLVYDIIRSLEPIIKSRPAKLTASGGGARDSLLQFIADLVMVPVEHSAMRDRTAYGVYRLLNPDQDYSAFKSDKIFYPSKNNVDKKIKQWHAAIASIL